MSEVNVYIRKLVGTVREYVHDLRKENETLRALLTAFTSGSLEGLRAETLAGHTIEAQPTPHASIPDEQMTALAQSLEHELDTRRRHREVLVRTVLEIEAQSRRTMESYTDVEQQYANLLNLFVASQSLHQSTQHDDVLRALTEIVINIIGSEELAIFEMEPSEARLRVVASFGIDTGRLETLEDANEIIDRAVKSGQTWVGIDSSSAQARNCGLTAVVPLRLENRVTGAIAIFRLLAHKPALTTVDRELFELLATHAAAALYLTQRLDAERHAV
jgi:hypothetical protein